MIQIGDTFLCKKDVKMNKSGRILYKKDKIYRSELNDCITNDDGNICHCWSFDESESYTWRDYFFKLDAIIDDKAPLDNLGLKIKVKKLLENAVIPSLGTEMAIGYDLYCPNDFYIKQGRSIIPLGFAIEMPTNIEAKIEPRSGYSAKGVEGYSDKVRYYDCISERFDADVLSGKIDPDYRDEVGVIIYNHGDSFFIRKNTRIAQMTFYKTEKVEWVESDELSETNRDGGFGSTNK